MVKMLDTPYTILGINSNATLEEIKKAYHKKVIENHPDLHPEDPYATQRMQEINTAYDMLIHPEKYEAQSAENTYSDSTNDYSYNDNYCDNDYYDNNYYEEPQYNSYDESYQNTENSCTNVPEQKNTVSTILNFISNLFWFGLALLHLIPIIQTLIWFIQLIFPIIKWTFTFFALIICSAR